MDVVPGAAEALPVKSEAFDAAVASLVLCTVRDVPRALAELRRVLRPGGELRFFEHGLAPGAGAGGGAARAGPHGVAAAVRRLSHRRGTRSRRSGGGLRAGHVPQVLRMPDTGRAAADLARA